MNELKRKEGIKMFTSDSGSKFRANSTSLLFKPFIMCKSFNRTDPINEFLVKRPKSRTVRLTDLVDKS